MSAEAGRNKSGWVWAVGGAAIVDYSGGLRNILLIAKQVDDLAIQRMEPVLKDVKRRMDLFRPSSFAEDGADLLLRIDKTIERWSEKRKKK